MAVTIAMKKEQVELVRDRFDRSVAAVLLDFRGVNVEMITDLRSRFRAAEVEYRVVKNNLVRKAIEGTELAELDDLDKTLTGMTGIAWTYEDPSRAAKIVKAFRKEGPEQEKLQIKGGVLEGEFMDSKAVENVLANLPGKDEVRAMLLAQMMAPMQSLVAQLNAPAQNLALVMDAYKRKQNGE